MYLDSIGIKKTTAGSTYSQLSDQPLVINKGRKKSRLQFVSEGDPLSDFDATITNIYVEVVSKTVTGFCKYQCLSRLKKKFVCVTWKNNRIYINVNSLSKRLGISKEYIYQAHLQHWLDELIKSSYEVYLWKQKRAIQFLNSVSAQMKKKLSIDLINKVALVVAFYGLKNKEQTGYLLDSKHIIFLKKRADDLSPIVTLFTKNVIGHGSYSAVTIVYEISHNRYSVAKIAAQNIFRAPRYIKKECAILRSLYRESTYLVGIQDLPYAKFSFKLTTASRKRPILYQGYISPKYKGDLRKNIRDLNYTQKIICAGQLLKGLQTLNERFVCHGDIKLANCLLRYEGNRLFCDLADFGGAKNLKEKIAYPSIRTYAYTLKDDEKNYSDLMTQYRERETLKNCYNLVMFIMSLDVYSMGVLLEKMFKKEKKQKDPQIESLHSLIKNMKNPKWSERISATKSFEEFKKIFGVIV